MILLRGGKRTTYVLNFEIYKTDDVGTPFARFEFRGTNSKIQSTEIVDLFRSEIDDGR